MERTRHLLWYFVSACALVLVAPLIIMSPQPFLGVTDLAGLACVMKVVS